MPLRITCPGCKNPFVLGDDQRGKSVRCPSCQKVLAIPPATTASKPAVTPASVGAAKESLTREAVMERTPAPPAPVRREPKADKEERVDSTRRERGTGEKRPKKAS